MRSWKSSSNLTLLLRLVFSCVQPRSNFLACRIHRLTCVHPNKVQWFHARISALLHRDNLVDTFRMYAVNFFTSRGQHKIFWKIPTVDIIPESSPSSQDLISRGISGNVPAISSNAFNRSFSLTCSRSAFRNVAINFGGYVFDSVVCISGLFQFLSQNSCACPFKVALQGYFILQLFVKKPFVFRTYSLDFDRIF